MVGYRDGDPAGRRQFKTILDVDKGDKPFKLDYGSSLNRIRLSYQTYGARPHFDRGSGVSNVTVVIPALTGGVNMLGVKDGAYSCDGWWGTDELNWPVLDLAKNHVIVIDVLGGHDGSTNALTPLPPRNRPDPHQNGHLLERTIEECQYDGMIPDATTIKTFEGGEFQRTLWRPNFPMITTHDMAVVNNILLRQLAEKNPAYSRVHLMGGSMGGQVAIEMACNNPAQFQTVALISSNFRTAAIQRSWSDSVLEALQLDPYLGLKLAREMSFPYFYSQKGFSNRFNHQNVPDDIHVPVFSLREYSEYHALHLDEIIERMSAISLYLKQDALRDHWLGRTKEEFDLLRDVGPAYDPPPGFIIGRIQGALQKLKGGPSIEPVHVLFISEESDLLFPASEQRESHEVADDLGVDCDLAKLRSRSEDPDLPRDGHDAFLRNPAGIGEHIQAQQDRFNRDHNYVPFADPEFVMRRILAENGTMSLSYN
jgi:homoserine acetyltransferase